MKENEVEDWKTGKVGKAGFRNRKLEMTVTLPSKGLLAVPDKARSWGQALEYEVGSHHQRGESQSCETDDVQGN